MPKSRARSSWLSRFRRNRSAKSKSVYGNRSRQLAIEVLEKRQVLVATLYVDFGDLIGAGFGSISLQQNSTPGTAGWDRLGLPLADGEQQWIFGPQFPYAGNPTLTYIPLARVIQERPNFSFSIGPQNINDPFEFETGPDLPVSTVDALEASIMNQLVRIFAPFNIAVQEFNATGLDQMRAQLSFNNRLENPNAEQPEWADGRGPDGPIGRNWRVGDSDPGVMTVITDPLTGMMLNPRTGDAYILVGGWYRGTDLNPATRFEVGSEAGIYGTSDFNFTSLITPPLDMGMPVPDPIFGTQPIEYSDGGGAVSADTIIDQHIAGNLKANVAIASVVAQTAAFTFGLFHSHDGLPTVLNPFFNPDIDLITGSDVMREGPGEFPSVSPTNNNMPFFSNFDMMFGDGNVNMLSTQNAVDYFNSNLDFNFDFAQNPNINFLVFNGQPQFGVGSITGTGAHDKITIADAGGGFARVQVRPYRDDSLSSGSFISTWDDLNFGFTTEATPYEYLFDFVSLPFLLVELGRGDDLIEIDESLLPLLGFGATELFIFGGGGVDRLTITGTGAEVALFNPFYRNDVGFDQTRDHDAQILVATGSGLLEINMFEFDDTSTVLLDNFATVTHAAPAHLPSNIVVDFFGGLIRVDGTAGPTFAPNGQELSPIVGMTNLEVTNTDNIIIDTSAAFLGGSLSDDVVTVRSHGAVPAGLLTFDVRTGNDGSQLLGTIGDTIHFDDSASFTPIDYTINSTTVLHSTTPGFLGFTYSGAERLIVTGTKGPNTFTASPSVTTPYTIHGDEPGAGSFPGDVLNIVPAVPGQELVGSGVEGSGTWIFPAPLKSITFTGIENSLFPTDPSIAQELLALGGGDAGQGEPIVQIIDATTRAVLNTFHAYDPDFQGGVRLTTADLNGDGTVEVITAPGMGIVGEIKIFDPLNATGPSDYLTSFVPATGESFTNGYYIAVGDIDDFGNPEIIVSRGRGASKIQVYSVDNSLAVTLMTTLNLPFESNVIGGVVVSSGNVRGDGRWEVIAAPASGVAAQVRVFEWSGAALVKKSQFGTFPSSYLNGVSITAGDIDGNGIDEIIVGKGVQGQSEVRVYSATGSGSLTLQPIHTFQAFTTGNTNAALRVTTHRVNSVNRDILFVSQGNDGQSGEIRLFDLSLTPTLVDTIFATDPGFGGGINVG